MPRPSRRLLVLPPALFLSILFIVMPPAGAETSASGAVELDGTMSAGEWDDATRHALEGGGEVLHRSDGDSWYVALSGPEGAWGHLYLFHDGAVHVAHASAALGTAVYEPADDETWTRRQGFTWEVRGTGHSDEDVAARRDFRQRNGWVASTVRMGTSGVLEFAVDRSHFDGDLAWAVAIADDAESPHVWPPGLADDTLDQQLLFGNAPEMLRFDPSTWSRLSQGGSASADLQGLYEADQADRQGNRHDADWQAIFRRDFKDG